MRIESQRPWNVAWGLVGRGTGTSNINSTSTTDQTIASVTWTAVAGRLYEIVCGNRYVASTVAGDLIQLRVKESSTVLRHCYGVYNASGGFIGVVPSFRMSGVSAGSHTYDYTIQRTSGSGTCTAYCDGTGGQAEILVMDIGPA